MPQVNYTISDPLDFHLSLHPTLGNLIKHKIIEAVYIGGSTSRKGPSKKKDLDLFLVTTKHTLLSELTTLLDATFEPPEYIVSDPSFLDGFGDFFKVLHKSYPLDLFVNSVEAFHYNRMMDGNNIVFDRKGEVTKIIQTGDQGKYLAGRIKSAKVDIVYYINLFHSKMRKKQIASSVRSYLRFVQALAELSMFADDPNSIPYLGINEDEMVHHLVNRFGIDYCDLSIDSMWAAARCACDFLRATDKTYSEFLHVKF
ncbi:MAG: hypothetical protein AAF429_12410 [Pseudomonadota bacterium]